MPVEHNIAIFVPVFLKLLIISCIKNVFPVPAWPVIKILWPATTALYARALFIFDLNS